MDELQIKAKLVESLLDESPTIVLASEVSFAHGARRADLVSLSGRDATVFEIKSKGDKVNRLDYQIEAYKKFFDYCYIVCEEENLAAVRKNIGSSIGVIVIAKGEPRFVRKSKRFKRHDKELLVSILKIEELKKLTGQTALRSKEELCRYAAKKYDIGLLRDLSRANLIEKYSSVTKLLRGEVVKLVNPDDIQTITKTAPEDIVLAS